VLGEGSLIAFYDIEPASGTVMHQMYAVKDADDRPTGSDVELRIGREWGSTECWLQFNLNSIPRYSQVDNVTFWFYHTRTTYQENAIRMMGNDDCDWTEDGVDKPDGNWSTSALAWYDYGDAQMPPMWMGWNDTKTATMGLQYPFEYGPVTGHLTEYINEILMRENRNLTLVLRNIWGDGAGGSHYHASRESEHVPYLEFVYLYTPPVPEFPIGLAVEILFIPVIIYILWKSKQKEKVLP